MPETVCQNDKGGGITSGGGFSNLYSTPTWQKNHVTDYLSQMTGNIAPYPGFGSGRGYPDISVAGTGYLFIAGANILGAGGTSVSAPVVAGILSLINAARFRGGGPAIGFISPALYANSTIFMNDITKGKNNCSASTLCCREGFSAAPGWDPASGLGSINVREFKKYMLGLVNITAPSDPPTKRPTYKKTLRPSKVPTLMPVMSTLPTGDSTSNMLRSNDPTSMSGSPSAAPFEIPTTTPSESPSLSPSWSPSVSPSKTPTAIPSLSPSESPSEIPTTTPSESPSLSPSVSPSDIPTAIPYESPSLCPSLSPSWSPSVALTPSLLDNSDEKSISHDDDYNFHDVPTIEPTLKPTRKTSVRKSLKPSKRTTRKPIVVRS